MNGTRWHSSQSYVHRPQSIVVSVTGATGTIFAVRLLERLRELNIETHLVMSEWASVALK
jgi:phenylacrylic acid decarboxylase